MFNWLRRRREPPPEQWRQWYLVYTGEPQAPDWVMQLTGPVEGVFYRRSEAAPLFEPFAAEADPPHQALAACQGVVRLTAVYPKSVETFMALARFACGQAEAEAGLLAIPPVNRTWLAAEWRPHLESFDLMAHTTVHLVGEEGGRSWVHTHGLVQFALPEVEVRQVPAELQPVAGNFVNMLGQWMVEGERFGPGHTVQAPWNPERWAVVEDASGRQQDPHPRGVPVLRFCDFDPQTKRAAPGLNLFLAGLTEGQ